MRCQKSLSALASLAHLGTCECSSADIRRGRAQRGKVLLVIEAPIQRQQYQSLRAPAAGWPLSGCPLKAAACRPAQGFPLNVVYSVLRTRVAEENAKLWMLLVLNSPSQSILGGEALKESALLAPELRGVTAQGHCTEKPDSSEGIQLCRELPVVRDPRAHSEGGLEGELCSHCWGTSSSQACFCPDVFHL